MDTLDNKCPACGATITFNPVNQMWNCEYCASKFSLEEMEQNNNSSFEETHIVDELLPEDTIGDLNLYCCENCGAGIMANQIMPATFCVYCGSTVVLKERVLNGRAPNYIMPFKTTKEDAVNGFKKITKGRLLMPNDFKELTNIEKISGIYIPFWAYDLEANGEVEFEASDIKKWKDSRYRYKKIDRYSIRKSGHFDFLKVLTDASTRFPDDLIDLLEPFDYNLLTSYDYSHLTGFLTEKYDVDELEGLKKVTGKTKDLAVSLMKQTVGHNEQKVINNGIRVSSRYTHYILLPIWLLNIKYKDKTYTFAMNGQTGKVVGNIPIGAKEIIVWSLVFFAILFVVGLVFTWLVL